MEIFLVEKIENIIERYKLIIYILSPTFGLYYSIKKNIILDSEIIEKSKRKLKKRLLADLSKTLFMIISCTIFLLFIINEINYNYNQNTAYNYFNLVILLVVLIFNIIMLLFLIKLWDKWRGEYRITNKGLKIESIFKFNILIFLVVFIVIYTLLSYKFITVNKFYILIFTLPLVYYFGVSRPIHFFLVFVPDFIKKIVVTKKRNTDRKIRLIIISIASFFNIILDYTILFYCLLIIFNICFTDINIFNTSVNSIIDMLYFASGLSDINTNNILIEIYIMIKNLSITLLITGNLAIYIDIPTKNKIN